MSRVQESLSLKDMPIFKLDMSAFSKSQKEKEEIKKAKADWRAGMYEFFGPHWKMISKIYRVYNVPTDADVKAFYKNMIKTLGLDN